MRSPFRIFAALVALVLLNSTVAARAATLAEVLDAAWQADAQWSAALRIWEAEQQNVIQGRSALLPSVNASYTWLENRREFPDLGIPSRESTDQALTFTLAQPLFRPGAWNAYKQSDAATSVAAAQFQQSRQDFLLRVAEQYFGVLRAWENLTSIRAEERAIGRQLEQTRERFDVGLVPITDVYEAEAAYDLTRVELIVLESEFDIARDRLEALTGRTWQSLAALRDELPLSGPEPADPTQWVELAREQNPALLASLHESEAARYLARQDSYAMAPTVDLIAQHQRTKTDLDLGGNQLGQIGQDINSTAYGIEVNMPLFAGGGLNSRRKQSALRHAASQDIYQQTWRDVGQQTLATYRMVSANAQRITARAQAIRSAESALEATEAGYEVGTRNIVDVLNAQRTLFAARRDYANARYEYIIDSLGLKALAGVLEEQDLQQVNNWLEPMNQVELDRVRDESPLNN